MTRVLFAGRDAEQGVWRDALLAQDPALDLVFPQDGVAPGQIDVMLYAPSGPIRDLAPYAHVKAIMSLWAGVETLLANPTLPPEVPVIRMVDDGMTEGMTEYVVGHVLRLHLGMDAQRAAQTARRWVEHTPPLARARRVGVAGLGVLGRDAAERLSGLRFDVSGWSRTEKTIPGVTCLHGPDGFSRLLADSEILVLLTPLTPQTANMMDAAAFARMRPGAHLVNAARGALIDEAALLAALESGRLGSATLDVFRQEPPPPDHAFWSHPRITMTPHIASATRPATAAASVIRQLRRIEAGAPPEHLASRKLGY